MFCYSHKKCDWLEHDYSALKYSRLKTKVCLGAFPFSRWLIEYNEFRNKRIETPSPRVHFFSTDKSQLKYEGAFPFSRWLIEYNEFRNKRIETPCLVCIFSPQTNLSSILTPNSFISKFAVLNRENGNAPSLLSPSE